MSQQIQLFFGTLFESLPECLAINERFGEIDISYSDHTKRAKQRMLKVMNAKSKKARKKQYEDLLKVTHKTVKYANNAVSLLEVHTFSNLALSAKRAWVSDLHI